MNPRAKRIADIVASVLLLNASDGFRSGLGVMLLISLAAAALVSRGALMLFYAALASIAILLEQTYWLLRFDAPERIFGVRFAGAMLRGKIDGRFRDKNGGVWHFEHKNYSRISEDTLQKKLSFDLQNLFYLLADRVERGENIKGVLYNVLRRPEVRKEMPVGKIRQYVTGLIEKDPAHYFIRWEIPYSAEDRAQFHAELVVKLDRLGGNIASTQLYGANPLGMFYKNECACDLPWACPYLDACASGSMTGYTKTKSLFPELEPKGE